MLYSLINCKLADPVLADRMIETETVNTADVFFVLF